MGEEETPTEASSRPMTMGRKTPANAFGIDSLRVSKRRDATRTSPAPRLIAA